MADHELTRLSGRQQLSEALTDEAAAAQVLDPHWGDSPLGWTNRIALLLVDVDPGALEARFGPGAAGEALTQIGHRMRSVLRANQVLARLGGDEFAVVLPGAGREVAGRVAQALLAQLEDVQVGAEPIRIRASIGIATCRLPRDDPGALVGRAALAMVRARQSGGGISHHEADQESGTRLPPIGELRVALADGALEVHLQPQVDLGTGRVRGAEALARWRHPQDGVLLPASFLPLAAQTGLMGPVATRVTRQAIAACRQWWTRGIRVPVSVNLSASDLLDDALTEQIPGYLEPAGLPPEALRIEITEEALVSEPETVAVLLHRWREAGVVVALDDFGTGYSSLAYLRELPIGELKLDQVFIRDLARPSTATIVRHTIAMAHDLGMPVVAEGVEDATAARRLAEMRCDIGQGLFFAPAMPVEQLLTYLDARSRR